MDSPRFAVIRNSGRIVPWRQWHVHDYSTGVVARLDNPDMQEGPLAYFSEQRLAEEWLARHEPLQRVGCDLCDRLFGPDDKPCRHLADARERAVWAKARELAEVCGCRRADVHEGVARARAEIRAEQGGKISS